MTNAQKIRLRLSQVRQRLNEIAGVEGDAFTDEVRSEAASLQAEFADLETRHQAAIVAEGEGETRANGGGSGDLDAEARERLELRSKASLTAYLRAALSGRQVDGPEAELREAAGIGDGIPLELWDVPTETRDPGCAHGCAGDRWREPRQNPASRVRRQHRATARHRDASRGVGFLRFRDDHHELDGG